MHLILLIQSKSNLKSVYKIYILTLKTRAMQSQRPVAAYIIFENHPNLQDKIPLFEGQNVIGRVPDKASVIIKDAQISSCHAKIKIKPTAITIVDMGSKNGTFLDIDTRQRIDKGKQYQVIENQVLSFGEVEFHIERVTQQKKTNISPKNSKEVPQKKLNLLNEFDQYAQKESKKAKNPKDHNNSAIEQKAFEKPKKDSQKGLKGRKDNSKTQQAQENSDIQSSIEIPVKKSKEDDQKIKLTKQKEQKDKKQKQKKQKELKQKKLKQQKEKKEREEQLKRQREQAERSKQEQRENKEKEQRQKKEKEQKVKRQKQFNMREQQEKKKKPIDNKKDSNKNASKNDQNENKYLNPNPKNSKGRNSKSVSNQRKGKKTNKQKSKEKSIDSQPTSRNSSISPSKKKTQAKIENRKRVPVVNDKAETDEVKGYRLRQKLLKVTKFKISGNPITYHTSPLLKLADDSDDEYDVLVMDGFIRTYKLLFAISKGIPVVRKSWLAESEYNKKISEIDFHWLEYPGDKWVIRESVNKVMRGEQILEGMEFFIATSHQNLHLPPQKLQRLIYNCGGSVILFSANIKAKNVYVLVERHAGDEGELKKARSVNKEKVYDVELVLEGILMQRLDFEKHKIDF